MVQGNNRHCYFSISVISVVLIAIPITLFWRGPDWPCRRWAWRGARFILLLLIIIINYNNFYITAGRTGLVGGGLGVQLDLYYLLLFIIINYNNFILLRAGPALSAVGLAWSSIHIIIINYNIINYNNCYISAGRTGLVGGGLGVQLEAKGCLLEALSSVR